MGVDMATLRRRYGVWWFIGGVVAVVCLGIGLGSLRASAAAPSSPVRNAGASRSLSTEARPEAVAANKNKSAGEKVSTGSPADLTTRYDPSSCPGNYQIVQVGSGTEVSGTNLILGSQCDDCEVPITLPF